MYTTRRRFLKTSAGAGAAISMPTLIPASVLGQNGAVAPSNRATIGIVGCGNQSKSCISYKHYAKAEIVAVCDPFLNRRQERAEQWGAAHQFNDFRDLLARDDIDAVHVVTPDHWHVPISLAAARAGKDVYCEKPLGISIEQNLATREIIEKHNRVFQYGAQQRSSAACRMGVELVLNGHIGDIKEIFVWAPGGGAGGNPRPQPIPEGFDYDMWLGPAPEAPYCPDRVSNRGAWFIYDYAIGFIAGWGAHPLDILQWWADTSGMGIPVEYKTTGSIPQQGLYNTVTNWEMEALYANGLKVNFIDSMQVQKPDAKIPDAMKELVQESSNGTFFMGESGWVSVSRSLFRASTEEIRRKAKDPGPIRLMESRSHMGNFADSILERKQPISDLETAIRSDTISHLGNIGIRTGETLKWDPVKETIVGSDAAKAMMHRAMRGPWTI